MFIAPDQAYHDFPGTLQHWPEDYTGWRFARFLDKVPPPYIAHLVQCNEDSIFNQVGNGSVWSCLQ